MGWSVRQKRTFVPGSVIVDDLDGYDTYVVDMGMLRELIPPDSTTAIDFVHWTLLSILARVRARRVLLAFDSPHLYTEARHVILYPVRYPTTEYTGEKPGKVYHEPSRRYYDADSVPVPDAIAATVTMQAMPVSWKRLQSSAMGKTKMIEAVEEALIRCLRMGLGEKDVQYILCRQSGDIFYHPHSCSPLPPLRYGEADQKALHYATHFAHMYPGEQVLIHSKDWDLVLSALGYHLPNVHIMISSPFVHKDTPLPLSHEDSECELTRVKAEKKWGTSMKRASEVLDMGVYVTNFDRLARMHIAFWSLCAGGADYCPKGLCPFGFTETKMLLRVAADHDPIFEIRSVGLARRVVFYPQVFLDAIKSYRMKRKTNEENVSKFSTAVQRILFNLMYYFGIDAGNGGPPLPDEDCILFNGESVTGLLYLPYKGPRAITFHEEHPFTEETLPYPRQALMD